MIHQQGREYEVIEMSKSEYCQALREKLIEEAQEAATAEPQKLVTELADLYEVIDSIMNAYGINRDLLLAEQKIAGLIGVASPNEFDFCGLSRGIPKQFLDTPLI